MILRANGLHGALGREARQDLDGQLGAYAADGDESFKETLLIAIEKAEEGNLIFADLRVDVEGGFRTDARERGEGRHGDDDVVPHACGFDDGLARLFMNQFAAKMRDHLRLLYVPGARHISSAKQVLRSPPPNGKTFGTPLAQD